MKAIKGLSVAIRVLSIIALVAVCIGLVLSVLSALAVAMLPESIVSWDVKTDVNVNINWDVLNIPDEIKSAVSGAVGEIGNVGSSVVSGNLSSAVWIVAQLALSLVCQLLVFAFIIKACNGICEKEGTVYSEKTKKALVWLGIALLANRFLPAIFGSVVGLFVNTYTTFTFELSFEDVILTLVYIAAYLLYRSLGSSAENGDDGDSLGVEVFPLIDTPDIT